jgi:regulator of sirC expression with transglutaminase-like and TPR domain
MSDADQDQRAFEAMVTLPDDAIDLAHASLLIARAEYPTLQIGRYLAMLDDMAADLRARMRGGEGPASQVAHLNRMLFEDLGFRGNHEEYDDPRNSFLNDVLERRVGIPITLSTIYMEIGRRIGCPLAGVAFPGHFLVRTNGRDVAGDIVIDPFNRGRLLSEADCRAHLLESTQGRIPFRPELLKRASRKEILARMLNNLKMIYRLQRDFHMSLRVQNMLLCLTRGRPEEIRDRGIIYYHLACLGQAVSDLEAYLEAAPLALDAPAIHQRLASLKPLVPVMN